MQNFSTFTDKTQGPPTGGQGATGRRLGWWVPARSGEVRLPSLAVPRPGVCVLSLCHHQLLHFAKCRAPRPAGTGLADGGPASWCWGSRALLSGGLPPVGVSTLAALG